MRWPELEYFFLLWKQWGILDIWCGNGRLLESYLSYFSVYPDTYIGIDLSADLIDEARKIHENAEFIIANMLEIESLLKGKKFSQVFLIASFHHLETLEEREDMMEKLYKLTQEGWHVYMTNWALESSLNKLKYAESKINGSSNSFNSSDFNIKIGEYCRFYHSFSLEELTYLAEKSWFKMVENREFEGGRNIITILQK